MLAGFPVAFLSFPTVLFLETKSMKGEKVQVMTWNSLLCFRHAGMPAGLVRSPREASRAVVQGPGVGSSPPAGHATLAKLPCLLELVFAPRGKGGDAGHED